MPDYSDIYEWLDDGNAHQFASELKDAADALETAEGRTADGWGDAYRESYLPVKEKFENAAELFKEAGYTTEDNRSVKPDDAYVNSYIDAHQLVDEALRHDIESPPLPSAVRSEMETQRGLIRDKFNDLPRP